MTQEKIGKFIAECRKEKGLTQELFAEKLGTSSKSISRWENGRTMPDYSVIEDITKILDISINEFFYGERISKSEIENISEENLRRMFREMYGKSLKRKYALLTGILGAIVSVLIFVLINTIL